MRFCLFLCILAPPVASLCAADLVAVPVKDSRICAPIVYQDLMLIVSTKRGVAAFVFGKEINEGVTYRFRFRPNGDAKEELGSAGVFEKYKQLPGKGGQVTLEDHGSELLLKAGAIGLAWSHCTEGKGWIYYRPESVRVQIGSDEDFDGIQLERFAW